MATDSGKRAVDPAKLPTLQSQMFKYFGGFITLAVLLIFTVCVPMAQRRRATVHGELAFLTGWPGALR